LPEKSQQKKKKLIFVQGQRMERGSDVWGKEGVEPELLQEEDARASRPPSEIRRSYETTDAQGCAGLMARAKGWAKTLKRQIVTLYLAYQHPLTPWFASSPLFYCC
jgi:hypothetical protein